ncbi:MAG TPA: hypothetical protein V6D17_02575 [Candidatus Obscuribacterales bacterium]
MNTEHREQLAALKEQTDSVFDKIETLSNRVGEDTPLGPQQHLFEAAESALLAEELLFVAEHLPEEVWADANGTESNANEQSDTDGEADDDLSGLGWLGLLFGNPMEELMDNNQNTDACCTDKDTGVNAHDAKGEKKILPVRPVPVILIQPGTDEYFAEDTPLEADALGNSKPVKIDDAVATERDDNKGDASKGDAPKGGKTDPVEDDEPAITCIIVPTRKDLANSLLAGARRLLGLANNSVKCAEDGLSGSCCITPESEEAEDKPGNLPDDSGCKPGGA